MFEEGVQLVFTSMTALLLAVEQQFGGRNSAEKGNRLIQKTIAWFYKQEGELAVAQNCKIPDDACAAGGFA